MSGDVAVAYQGDTLSRKASAPNRRSILSRIAPSNELNQAVSNTDAVLRNRRPSASGSNNSGSTRRKNRSGSQNGSDQRVGSPEYSTSPLNEEPVVENGSDNRRDSDSKSNSSRSGGGKLGRILSRSRSRQGSVEPESEAGSGQDTSRRRSFTGGKARRLQKNGSFQNGTAIAENGDVNGATNDQGSDDVPPVPQVPSQHSRPTLYANGDGRTASAGVIKDSSIPVHPSKGVNGAQNGSQDDEEQKGLLGGAYAAIAGAGAAAGGAAAAIASKVTGSEQAEEKPQLRRARSGTESEGDDEFHDADNGDENVEAAAATAKKQGSRPKNDQRDSQRSHDSHVHRHRGLSEGEGVALGAGTGAGAAGAAFAGNRQKQSRPPKSHQRQSSRDTGNVSIDSNASKQQTPKRRSGSVPTTVSESNTATSADKKAREETPFYVKEKAARVRKLTFDDVNMTEEEMFRDIAEARKALHLFLNSRMIEAEELIAKYSDSKLYYALGDALIAVIKGFMTFEPEDLAKAISYCKDALHMATLLRRQTNSVAKFGQFVRGTGHGPSTMAGMTIVQRHAELIFAESLLLKAVMGILYSGDFIGFVAEAFNMRNAYGIYRSLDKYVEWADKKASGKRDDSIDEDFRSGVFLGNGLISMILGLLPGKVLKIMEVFGYTGDTQWALKTLARAGDWSKKSDKPGMPIEDEGIRRQVCDMGILLYHLVISTFIPVTGVDIDFADKVLHYNLERYPQGVFFLYFSGRLYSTQSLAERAVVQFRKARDVQQEYVQLQHICVWDMSLCHMSLTQFDKAYECFKILLKDSNWSKCVYSYGEAANLWCSTDDKNDKRRKEAAEQFKSVPGKMQRIAGKSIPMEKYCARKAKKFIKQGRLLLPAHEFSYIYHCFTNAPAYSLSDNQLVDISEALQELNQVEDPSEYYSGADEYWDDYCLAHFLRGVTLRYIAYPEAHAKSQQSENPIPKDEAAEQAEISLRNVIESSHRISLDHFLCYFAHYELGRLYANKGDKSAAREQFDLIMSGKTLEASTKGKGKYSMQNMCTLRTNGALSVL